MGTTIYNPDQIIDILRLPELVMPVATITVGYPDECPSQVDRLPIEGICMKKYIMIIPKKILIVSIDIKSHFRKINPVIKVKSIKKTLAQVFTEVRYKKSDNECMSVTLKETLKKQGFEK